MFFQTSYNKPALCVIRNYELIEQIFLNLKYGLVFLETPFIYYIT